MRKHPDYREVTRKVRELLDEYGIEHPPINPVAIARDRGIGVKFVTFHGGYEGVSGFYDPNEDTIFVNKLENPLRQTFTIAHELGHALLHKDWAKSDKYTLFWRDLDRNNSEDVHEKEANAFAANLLVPRKMLNQYYGKLTDSDLSRLFAVSVPVVKNRLAFEYGF